MLSKRHMKVIKVNELLTINSHLKMIVREVYRCALAAIESFSRTVKCPFNVFHFTVYDNTFLSDRSSFKSLIFVNSVSWFAHQRMNAAMLP